MKKENTGRRTLLLSVLMSAPGPIVVGLGLLAGKSSTQLADFFRRSAELLAIICSFVIYCMTENEQSGRKEKLERAANLFVGFAMCAGGLIMIALALFAPSEEKGNVIPGLVIALLGVIANTLFWRKYTRLNRLSKNAILAVQARLYRAKALVDGCVTTALAAVALFPLSAAAAALDTAGSVIVAAYLVGCGVKTVKESTSRKA